MKKAITITLAVCLLAGIASISRADEDGKKKGDKGTRRAELIKKYDKNGDGKLDESERAAAKEERKKQRKENKQSEPKKEEKK